MSVFVDNFQNNRLDAAYRATCYVVELPDGPLTIRIGCLVPGLDEWMASGGWNCWSWLTSVNPCSRRLGEAENADRLVALQAVLDASGARWCRAKAVADDANWPDEPGFFVPGLACEAARDLAHHFGQAAFLHGVVGKVAELVWTGGEPVGADPS